MRRPVFLVICALVAVIAGCSPKSPTTNGGADPEQSQAPQAQTGETVTGTVRYLDFEGGFYGIVTDDGRDLLPDDLPEPFREDGLRIRAHVVGQDVATIRMWGTPVRILSIERLES